jgi:polar amino acid transport system substrate-binding protein
MAKVSKEKIIITCCICLILITLFLKSSIYEITNPAWFQASSSLAASKQPDSKEITVHFHDRRPFFTPHKDEARGVVANPIGLAFADADIPFHWQETPPKRQLDIIRHNKERSCAAGWFKTSDREKFGQYSVPVYQDKPFIAITRANNKLLGKTETMDRVFKERRLQVLVKAGYSYGPYIDNWIDQLNPRQVSNTADNMSMMKMIQAYRADYYFVTEEEALDMLIFSGLQSSDFKLIYFSDIPQGNTRYLICSKMVEEDTMKRINQAIRHVVSKAGSSE